MGRKLFCEISPLTYRISQHKEIMLRKAANKLRAIKLSRSKAEHKLPYTVYTHKSLIRRSLGNVDAALQENKAVNLAIAAPKISGVLIRPHETFSLWELLGRCTAKEGYREGLVIKQGKPDRDIGGGLCQLSNLIHWIILHSPLVVTERHHHDGVDLFPDFNRQVPFGLGTSILYNYLDYRFYNPTEYTFQLIVYTDPRYLCGELLCDHALEHSYHIKLIDEYFYKKDQQYYRVNTVNRRVIRKSDGIVVSDTCIANAHAKVLYDPKQINPNKIKTEA